MASQSLKVKSVLVIGAGGNVGRQAIKYLAIEGFEVSGLTRESSGVKLPAGVKHIKTNYSQKSLEEAFKGQDVVISTISGDGLALQKTIVDAAIAAGVKIIFPSEYGVDTSLPIAAEAIPFLQTKIELLDYIKNRQDQISWTALVAGSLFDWGLDIPSFGGIDVAARAATIYDSGDVPYEATNVEQVGRAIAAALKQPNAIKNKYVYVNSFTVTQNQVVRGLEKATGNKFTVSHDSVDNLRKGGFKQLEDGSFFGMLALIASAFYGKFGVADYSTTKGLWNDTLGLVQEDLDSSLASYILSKN
ncbi:NAD(P)-binding protein [Pyrenochaeta sp. DS3sAY3a]|nr:NAD(P)-binding protein [Pyrenochaeta sp. DS3sAY3a]